MSNNPDTKVTDELADALKAFRDADAEWLACRSRLAVLSRQERDLFIKRNNAAARHQFLLDAAKIKD